MKKIALFFALIAMLTVGKANAQLDLNMLNQAQAMLKGGNQEQIASALTKALPAIETATKSVSGPFGSKILGQLGSLGAMIPALQKGQANLGGLGKILSTLKMLFAAQQLKGLMNGNKFGGNAAALLSNVGLLKGGLSSLGSSANISALTKSLDFLTNKAPKLDKSGLFSGCAKKAISKSVGSTLGMLEGLL